MVKERKLVVTTLMRFRGIESINCNDGSTKTYLKHQWPKPGCNFIVNFATNTGFTNPYRHLLTCCGRNKPFDKQEIVIADLLEAAQISAKKSGGTILSHFNVNALSDYEKALHAYLRLIVLRNLRLSIVECTSFRSLSKFSEVIRCRQLTAAIVELATLVEKCISDEIPQTKGAVIYDSWTINSPHFTAIVASYFLPVPAVENCVSISVSHPRLALPAILPISQRIGSDESQCSFESTRFNAESYIQFLNETFDVYSSSFEEYCLALIGDNVSSNLRVSRMTGKPHISRASHRLNLEVKSMIENHADLSNAITSVRVTMREVKPKLKSSAELRNLIDLSPVIDNETMWSGKVKVLRRFQEIPEELIEAHEHPDADFTINTSLSFAGKCEKYRRMLAELYIVTNMLQTRGRTLAECERDLDTLIDAVNEDHSIS